MRHSTRKGDSAGASPAGRRTAVSEPTVQRAAGGEFKPPGSPNDPQRWTGTRDTLLAAICMAVVAFYGWRCAQGVSELGNTTPGRAYYNLLVQGFAAGQLNLAVETPPGLAALPDPWQPEANAPFRKKLFEDDRLHDTSYFRGRIYLYFSPTPALLLFGPFHAITGGHLEHRTAVAVFCSIGFIVAVGLWRAVCRRYFPSAPLVLVAGGAVALGMANTVPVMMGRPDVWEVPISCAYALTMAALTALWRALHEPDRSARWQAVASTAFALAVSARPSLLPAAPILLLPLIARWRNQEFPASGRPLWTGFAAVGIPLVVIGIGLAAYNYLRFENPFEFGQRYQLAHERQDPARQFSLSYFWYNFRLYFLAVAPWQDMFPFVGPVIAPPMPPGHGDVDGPFGILTNTPVTLLAFVLPFIARRGAGRTPALHQFVAAAAALFIIAAATLCLFHGTCTRYQVEFNAPLILVAVVGFAALHEAWRTTAPRLALGLVFLGATAAAVSAAFSVLKPFPKMAEFRSVRGTVLHARGDVPGALRLFESALRIAPGFAEAWFNAGIEHQNLGQVDEAIAHYEGCIRVAPTHMAARNNLGLLLKNERRLDEAAAVFRAAIAVEPRGAHLHFNLGLVLQDAGQPAAAAEALLNAVRLRPDFAEAHYRLVFSLHALGRIGEARQHYAEARRLQPALPELQF